MISSITIVINSPPSTLITFTPSSDNFISPVPIGSILGTFQITPSNWSGIISLDGPDKDYFIINKINNELQLAVGNSPLIDPRIYNLNAIALP